MSEAVLDATGETLRLAEFVDGLSAENLPVTALREAVRAFVNAVGCIVGGARHEMVEVACTALAEFAGAPVAAVIGRGVRLDSLSAALLNGLSGAAYSFDDAYGEAMLHPSVPVVAALLALADRTHVNGAALRVALVAGLETACRLSKALTVPPAVAEMAWSQTGVAAGIGAAVAAGKLLGLDRGQLASAIGLAASAAAGTRATHGSMAASLIYGHAAQCGLRAALLAGRGFTGGQHALEHKFGLAAVYAGKANLVALTGGLVSAPVEATDPLVRTSLQGMPFELLSITYKPFPCGLVIHPALDGILRLRSSHGFTAADVVRVDLRVHRGAVALGWNPEPRDDLEAKVSLPHWIAAAVLTGRAGLAEGRTEVVHDPEVRRLRAAIAAVADDNLAIDQAEVVVTLGDGSVHRVFVEHCVGSIRRPISDAEIGEKFLGQASLVLGWSRAEKLLRLCWQLPQLDDVGDLTRLAN